ncbi:MAG TPA: energy transducer TonB [Deltaproteobacteria bacterium]|nr:energy transducer TonB [Deltaproteobacteria bacterium]
MVRKNDLSVCLVVSLVLHSLFAVSLWGWFRSLAEARPSYDIIKVSIIQAPPAMGPFAPPAAPARLKSVSLAKPVELAKIMAPEKKVPEPVQEVEQTSPDDTQTGRESMAGVTGGASSGIPGAPAGTGETDGAISADRALANARDAYTAELYHIIRRYFVYPALARRRGQEGTVQLSFVVGDDGRAQDIKVMGSSGFGLLDRAAMDTIRKIPLPPPPRRAMQIPVTIVYRLEEGT